MESRLGRLNALADPMANPKRRGVTAFIVGTVLERGSRYCELTEVQKITFLLFCLTRTHEQTQKKK